MISFYSIVIMIIVLLLSTLYIITIKIKSKPLKWTLITITTIITPVLMLYSTHLFTGYAADFEHRNFELKEWKENKSKRIFYAQSLDTSDIINGKSSKEIIAILGEPDVKNDSMIAYDLTKDTWREGWINAQYVITLQDNVIKEHYFSW